VVLNRADLAVPIVADEVRINLGHFFGDQTVLGPPR
jgi:hypothetical protein